jgi:hypothetical protein
MGVYRFEDLRVWKAVKEQSDRVGELAFSSNGELKAGDYAANGRKYISERQVAELIELNESIARMLRRWRSKLEGDETLRELWTSDLVRIQTHRSVPVLGPA